MIYTHYDTMMDVNELVQTAEEYLKRRDYDKAKRCLKKAAALAPLRNDLREMLVEVIELETLGSGVIDERVRKKGRSAPPSVASRRRKRLLIALAGVVLSLTFLTMAAVVFWENMFPDPVKTQPAITTTPPPKETPDRLKEKREQLLESLKGASGQDKVDILNQIIATNPPESDLLVKQKALTQFQMGTQAKAKQQYSTAIEYFNAAIKTLPAGRDTKNVPFYYHLGKASFEKGCKTSNSGEARKDFSAAKKALLQAIEIDADWLMSYDFLARTYIRLDDRASAVSSYKKIISRNPGSPEATKAKGDLEMMGVE